MKYIIVLLLVASVAMNVYQWRGERHHEVVERIVTKTDTIVYERPIVRDSVIVRYVRESLPRVVRDTIRDSIIIRDSVLVEVPIVQKVYEGADYKAYVSGYNTALDSIFTYKHTDVVTIKAKPQRWGIGVGTGVGMTKNRIEPYIGIGVYYRLF